VVHNCHYNYNWVTARTNNVIYLCLIPWRTNLADFFIYFYLLTSIHVSWQPRFWRKRLTVLSTCSSSESWSRDRCSSSLWADSCRIVSWLVFWSSCNSSTLLLASSSSLLSALLSQTRTCSILTQQTTCNVITQQWCSGYKKYVARNQTKQTTLYYAYNIKHWMINTVFLLMRNA